MTYVIDVYRNDCKVQNKFSSLLLYVSFFPQLVAGPIVKYKDIESELENRQVSVSGCFHGSFRFSIGLAKKVLLANYLGKVVDILLLDVDSYSRLSIWIGLVFFLLQLYFDFSGYSDMAIGLGRIFGFHYKENFNYPYISSSIQDFWRRWHMSLGTFFREYVYIPLGGKYKYHIRNIFIVWALTGIWHGASYNFLLWGLYFAVLLIIEKYLVFRILDKLPKVLHIIISHIYTLFLLIVGIVLFYYENIGTIISIYANMFISKSIAMMNIFASSIIRENILLLLVAMFAATPIARNTAISMQNKYNGKTIIFIKFIIIVLLVFLSTTSILGDSYNPFLYFRF